MSVRPRTTPFRVALAGNPNCGKTALFNALTGGRARVGNYPGVTVERKEGFLLSSSTQPQISILDLPGTYSLAGRTPDEIITRDVLLGKLKEEALPDLLIAVVDATQLERNLSLFLELKKLNRPMILALNMMDLARLRGLELDLVTLSRELDVPVVPTVAVHREGIHALTEEINRHVHQSTSEADVTSTRSTWSPTSPDEVQQRFLRIDQILKLSTRKSAGPTPWTDRIDQVVLHPVWGSLLLVSVLLLMFQAIFTWAKLPQDWIQAGVSLLGAGLGQLVPQGALHSLLVNGVLAGVGSVLVFLPQILILFSFILMLEDSGYMARAAFLMDRIMGKVGLNGRAFIPLLSSHACAVPGIMATRTIEDRFDRLTTILSAPLTTCSARLPIYSLLIAAFIPNKILWGPFRLQGFIMFLLYFSGILAALGTAALFKATLFRGKRPALILELPTYKWPSPHNLMIGLLERCYLFLRRAGTVILSLSVIIWFLSSYPKTSNSSVDIAIQNSYAGKIGHAIEPVIRPIGFNWRIGIALIPGFAAREVMIGALGTVYAIEDKDGNEQGMHQALGKLLQKDWTLATALSLLVWYIFACQCLSTLAVTRRETNSWKWPAFMLAYMTVLAYGASFLTYRSALWLGWG